MNLETHSLILHNQVGREVAVRGLPSCDDSFFVDPDARRRVAQQRAPDGGASAVAAVLGHRGAGLLRQFVEVGQRGCRHAELRLGSLDDDVAFRDGEGRDGNPHNNQRAEHRQINQAIDPYCSLLSDSPDSGSLSSMSPQ